MTYETRTRFEGRFGRTAPRDLAIAAGGAVAQIVVAAKAFDSTGSKLTDAVREVEEMADVRKGNQTVMAAIDGVGWLSRARSHDGSRGRPGETGCRTHTDGTCPSTRYWRYRSCRPRPRVQGTGSRTWDRVNMFARSDRPRFFAGSDRT